MTSKIRQQLRHFATTLIATIVVSALFDSHVHGTTAPSAEELLRDSDRARGAAEGGVSWDIDLESIEDTTTNKVKYSIKAKGNDALAEALEPARYKGESYLFNDRTIWYFKPGLKKPVAISARQKLMGQAANGDIASTNYYRDYAGTVVGEESIDGEPAWKLELKAKAKNVTYDGIRYWISKKDRVGVKAEFLTVSGTMFKSAVFEYKNTINHQGKKQPFISQMTITDAVKTSNKTIIKYYEAKMESHADSLFNVNNLVR